MLLSATFNVSYPAPPFIVVLISVAPFSTMIVSLPVVKPSMLSPYIEEFSNLAPALIWIVSSPASPSILALSNFPELTKILSSPTPPCMPAPLNSAPLTFIISSPASAYTLA